MTSPLSVVVHQILILCPLIFPDKWNVASSLKTIFVVKMSSSSCFENQSKMCSEILCLGYLHAVRLGTCSFLIPDVSTEFCAVLCVACLIDGESACLICVDFGWRLHEKYPPELHWLVANLMKQFIRTNCKSTCFWLLSSKRRTKFRFAL
jgi:hypothetical protein